MLRLLKVARNSVAYELYMKPGKTSLVGVIEKLDALIVAIEAAEK